MAELADLRDFDLVAADLTVWVYKKSMKDGLPIFRGRWVGITDKLSEALRAAVSEARNAITETFNYEILAQNHEASALKLGADETHIALVEAQAQNATPARKVTKLKQIENSGFYVLRFVSEAGVLHAVRKTNASWRTRRSRDVRVVFSDQELDIDNRPSFSLEPYFDFFVCGGTVFISNKGGFEAVLSYRAGHAEAFEELAEDTDFTAMFTETGPIIEFVGTNKIQLRRAIAIREKGHYKDLAFMQNLREQGAAMNLGIQFDNKGRIVPTPETCRDIFRALLDHRLDSRLSKRLYDVQSTEPVTAS